MTDFVTRSELDEAITDVRREADEMEQRLRGEFTGTVRYEIGKLDKHLDQQDAKFHWVLGVLFSLLVAVIASLILLH